MDPDAFKPRGFQHIAVDLRSAAAVGQAQKRCGYPGPAAGFHLRSKFGGHVSLGAEFGEPGIGVAVMDRVQTDGMAGCNEFPHGIDGIGVDFLVKEKGATGVETAELRQQRQPLSVSGVVEGQTENAVLTFGESVFSHDYGLLWDCNAEEDVTILCYYPLAILLIALRCIERFQLNVVQHQSLAVLGGGIGE